MMKTNLRAGMMAAFLVISLTLVAAMKPSLLRLKRYR